MARRRPFAVRVTGPLAPFAQGFLEELARRGYRSGRGQLGLMAELSRWLGQRALAPEAIDDGLVDEFLAARRRAGKVLLVSRRAAAPMLGYVATQTGVVLHARPAAVSALDDLLWRYEHYLVQERAVSRQSVKVYMDVARSFLGRQPSTDRHDLEQLGPSDITDFILAEAARLKVSSAKATTTRLRSLLRFLYVEGITTEALVFAVPSVSGWRLASLPKVLPAGDVAKLLKSCDRRKATGRRDFAILTMLARMGLRVGEVAALELADIDWRQGEVTIRGKGNREDRLPLPVDVGEAVVAWLQRGRPRCESRSVFVTMRAPRRGLSSGGIAAVVAYACDRAAIPRVGAHRLRHTVASEMLRAGGTLDEVGDVLRHRRRDVTAIYAKVDRRALAAVVRPWPGRAS